ncbi:MAG: hypothetical protein LBM08_11140 [Dysgonamonadaceae bacterium]|jgi:transposase-like protein|nr:hypothetical protein [Dysgonamonadaceae bacterium]
MKYSDRLVERIVGLIETDMYTVSEICNAVGIDRKTFYEWKNGKPEFRKAVEEAADRCDELLVRMARISLKQRLEGYMVTEERIVCEPSRSNPSEWIDKSRVIKHKQYPPDLRAIQWVLERNDRKKADKQQFEPTKCEIRVSDAGIADRLRDEMQKLAMDQEDIPIVYEGREYPFFPETEKKEKREIPETAEMVAAPAPSAVEPPEMNSYSKVLPPGYLR